MAGIAEIVVGVVVAAIAGVIGVAVFLQVNTTLPATNNPSWALLNLTPLIIAAVVIIGAIAGGLAFVNR